MLPIEEAILRTILYADVFNFPLTLDEIHHFLIYAKTVTRHEIEQQLGRSQTLNEVVTCCSSYYALKGREDLASERATLECTADTLMASAMRHGMWLARLPFVRMVAVTGALAVRNPKDGRDDLDYFLIVEPGRVWLTRGLAILLVRFGRLRGVEICPNYVLASDRLAQRRRDLFIAREITQMIPIFGHEWYTAFRDANTWATTFQANADRPLYEQRVLHVTGFWFQMKRAAEWLLGGPIGNALETWEFRRKRAKFRAKMETYAETAAEIEAGVVKGHFDDYGNPALIAYRDRLQGFGLSV
ncbi:MAG: hypothetical protein AAF125_10420 [Chloroflexota bacterium]